MGYCLSEIMFDRPEDLLTQTSRCQPAPYLHGTIALAVIRERLPNFTPTGAAGLSLGEFTAHVVAVNVSFADGLSLVSRRGAFTEKACLDTQGVMAGACSSSALFGTSKKMSF